ncbi:uncharacterized protein KY384_002719 [Bacidia gigantensis]|uniref:uncharacterized protein n=1 Tax=Bacidia gigantensis TaxID=2732470 RepID=UPI001D03D162|nr:uncharacterized protein KY384_002719 [Bacidia gigantensis]KAG8532841.1 hypothetical protein KY384_002719 [Bacidia gigantensis]
MNHCLNCLECLGVRFRGSQSSETSRLLYDDPYRSQYGTNGTHNQRVIQQQPDAEALRREREEMEGICHRMSDQVIDVFNVAPQENDRGVTLEQAREIVMDYGVNPAHLSDAKVIAFIKKRHYEIRSDKSVGPHTSGEANRSKVGVASDAEPSSQEELEFKTIRRKGKTPLSVTLDKIDSEALGAVLG